MVTAVVSLRSFSDSRVMIRAMLNACRPWGMPQPAKTSFTLVGSTSGLRSSSWSIT